MKIDSSLRLIPESNFNGNIQINGLEVTSDEDNFDYILSSRNTAELKGDPYQDKRNLTNRFFIDNLSAKKAILDLSEKNIWKEIKMAFDLWAKEKGKTRIDVDHEWHALERLLSEPKSLDLIGIGVYLGTELIGFAIVEITSHQYSIFHFAKSIPTYKGLTEVIYKTAAEKLISLDREYINLEQDLGIPGLRQAKTLWRPISFLKKYIISPK